MTSSLSVATWNVNSVKARLGHLTDWLKRDSPDIVLLQELKCLKENFPYMEIEELGYNIALVGEKSYNGVAILSKFLLDDICECLPGRAEDIQARYIEAVASLPNGKAIRVASVYVPNGQSVESDKFPYKLDFFDRVAARVKMLLPYEELLVVGGDYNVAPFADDVPDPKRQDGAICFHPLERAHFRRILHSGVFDAYRLAHPADISDKADGYTWWDYRAGAWENNRGLRIDHLLVSAQAADALQECHVVRDVRALDKASDHAPVLGKFAI